MQPFLLTKLEEIAELCRRFHVKRLAVFGSALRGDFDPARSDVDVLVEFEPIPVEEYFDNKAGLRQGLATLLERDIDLVTWKSIRNPYLLRELEATQKLLYAA